MAFKFSKAPTIDKHRRELSQKYKFQRVRRMLEANMSPHDIAETLRISIGYVFDVRRMYLPIAIQLTIGPKKETYFTEFELLNGFSVKYEDLSPSEKQMYHEQGKLSSKL